MIKKGIILAGGMGTRMSPLTKSVNKQLLPIYDKPLIYYPLSILMLAKIKDILIIVNKGQLDQFKKLIPNGKNFGVKISYAEQSKPRGLPDAFIVGEKFIGKNNVALILGDNFFYGQSLTDKLKDCGKLSNGAKVLLHSVSRPELYGVAKINSKNKISYDMTIDSYIKPKFFTSCVAGRIFGVLKSNGDVYPCEILEKPLGNLRDYNFDFIKLWMNSESNATRKWIKDTYCNCT